MANWITCTTTDDVELRVNLDQVVMIRPYRSERGFSGSEIVFATGTPSPIIVKEDRAFLVGASQQKP